MTSFNREKYIAEAIESVLASTYKNFELLIVDDASTDKTVQLAKEYADRDGRIKLFVNPKNLGQFENRNLAARLCTGKYLKYVDSDDLLYPTGLAVLVSMMERYPDAGYGLCSLIQDDGRIYPFMLTPHQAFRRHFIQRIDLFHKAPLSSIIRKSAFEAIGGFNNPQAEGDYEMWLRLSLAHNVVLMPDGIVWYRVHDDQIDFTRRVDPIVQFRSFLITLKYLDGPNPLEPAERKAVVHTVHREVVKHIARTFLWTSCKKAVMMYREVPYRAGQFLGYYFDVVRTKLSGHA
jgi:glycosyltransferase involved in cell wall biosynthesis